ncbi:TPA: AIDA repeat-containing protein [Escherichia coli]|nr:AIDA repeat-containing protein [Escherichia coli]
MKRHQTEFSVLSILVTAALYTPQVMAFTEKVTADNSPVSGETVENGIQNVQDKGKTENITVGGRGGQIVQYGGLAENTLIKDNGWQSVSPGGTVENTIIENGGELIVNVRGKVKDTTIQCFLFSII